MKSMAVASAVPFGPPVRVGTGFEIAIWKHAGGRVPEKHPGPGACTSWKSRRHSRQIAPLKSSDAGKDPMTDPNILAAFREAISGLAETVRCQQTQLDLQRRALIFLFTLLKPADGEPRSPEVQKEIDALEVLFRLGDEQPPAAPE